MREWSNWSGSLRFTPERVAEPRDEEQLRVLVEQARERGRTVRVAGAGHSSSPLVETQDVLVSLKHFDAIHSHDSTTGEAVIGAGLTIREIGKAMLKRGLALHNTGDVDVQTLAGAIATGTHGTGRRLGNLATPLLGGRLVTGTGAVRAVAIEHDPAVIRALRVSLGALGIFTRLRVRLVPAFELRRREWCTHVDACMSRLDQLIADNRNFDFYWYPRSDLVKLRTMNDAGADHADIPDAECVRDATGWSHEILPRERELRFDEMEYALPFEAGPACFQEVRARVKARWRRIVGWRVLYRTIAADDAYLSPMHGRESVTISLHQNAGLPFAEYFADIEPVFRAHGGRPHWGKKHNLTARELRPLYPEWQRYCDARRTHDPDDVFLSPQLSRLLGEESA